MKLGFAVVTALVAGAAFAVEPCAQVDDQFNKAMKSNSTVLLPGDLVHQCLQSIPIRVPEAVSFIDEFRKYLYFQSTLETLQDPPPDYTGLPVDLLGGLDRIQTKARQNKYRSQFDFDSELLDLVSSANDGHLQIQPCSTAVFSFTHAEPLVSVSEDGLKLPEVYTLSDAKLLAQGRSASSVKSINATDVVEYLEKFASNQGQQDPDARYNTLFPSLTRSKVPKGLWMKTSWWPGSSMSLEFNNGTQKTYKTMATTDYTVFGARNGTAMYDRTCLSAKTSSSQASKRSVIFNAQTGRPGYPKAGVHGNGTHATGYFPSQAALQDTAVLSVPTFEEMPTTLSPFVKKFLRKATKQGKKKLLIDLSGNPGGVLASGFSLFADLFPGQEMYLGTRFRAHESAYSLGRVFSHTNNTSILQESEEEGDPFMPQKQVTPDQKTAFRSWDEVYGPHELLGTNTSSLLAEFNFTETAKNKDTPINGYGPVPLDPQTPAFAPEDITMITDGYCASTCTTFATLMKQHGVRSIAFGGRPRNGPMQAMGGVKGGQSMDMIFIWGFFERAQKIIGKWAGTKTPVLSHDEWKRFNETAVPNPNYLSLSVNTIGINVRNAYGRHDDSTPLQFVYEAAECRRFFTVDDYFHQEGVWKAAAEATFGDGKCVEGSTKGKGSLDAAPDSA